MNISVDGSRGSSSARDAVEGIAREQLPILTEEQKKVARQLGATEEAYSRMILANRRSQQELLVKTEMFVRLLEKKLRDIGSAATLQNVVLRARQERFDVEVKVNGRILPLRIREEVIDGLFEAGDADVEERLVRILRSTVGLAEHQ